MSQFLLILRDTPTDFVDFSPEEIQQIIGEYGAWRDKLASEGKMLGSNKLQDEGGKLLSLEEGRLRVVDGPYAEAKEIVGGYFLIDAADYEEAVEISKDCPHLKYGLGIALREVDQH